MKKLNYVIWLVIIISLYFKSAPVNAQQLSSGKKDPVNFYTAREVILKEIADAKEKHLLNEDNKFEDNSLVKFRRWEHFVAPRVFPSGNFYAPDAVYNEYARYYSVASHKSSSLSNTWEAVGPFNNFPNTIPLVGIGRMNCIAQHPLDTNILYIGTMGGGIWKTIDGGLNWTSLNDNLPSMSFSDIAINPNNPDTIYAASGDAVGNYTVATDPAFHQGHYSAGIMMSPDGGATWSQTGFNYQQFETINIYRLVIDPVNPNNLLAGTETGLYRTTDAGATWLQLDTTLIIDIKINPLDPQKYYAISENGIRMKRSFDGGTTWSSTNINPLTGGTGLSKIGISAADTSVVYVMRGYGRLFKTINGGNTFVTAGVPGNSFFHQGNYDKAFAVSPLNTDVLLLGLVELVKSINGGLNFNVVDSMYSPDYGIHVDFHSLEFAYNNPNKVYAVSDGGVYVSYDEGASWTSLNNGINVTQYYKMNSSFLNPDYILAGAQDNSTHLLASTAWEVVTCCDGLDCSFDKTDENIAYASTQFGLVYRSADGGHTFPIYISPPGFNGSWETPHQINPLRNQTIYLAGASVMISFNRGDSWQNFSPALDTVLLLTSLAQSPADTNVFYTASFDHLWVTTDNGLNWIDRTAGLPVVQSAIYGLTLSNDNAMVAYVTLAGFAAGEKVYKTTDGGVNWTNISGTLPNIPCNSIIIQDVAPYNDVYLGTDFGVFYLNDTLSDWIPYNTGLPGVIVVDLDLNYRSGKLYAATHGRGIYKVDPITPVVSILNDVAVLEISEPIVAAYCDSLSAPLVVQIKNYGANTLTSLDINYTIDGGSIITIPWSGTLATFGIFTDTLATLTLYGGSHNINVYTSNPNGSSDDYAMNDSKQTTLFISTAIASFPYAEGFENAYPPTDWNDSGNMWYPNNTGAFGASAKSARAAFYTIQSGSGYLTSLRIDLTTATPSTFLGFAHAYARYDPTYLDSLLISVTNDCTENWDTIYVKSDTALATVANLVLNPFVPLPGDWAYNYIDISSYIGQVIKVRFEANSGWGNDLYLDDINLFHGSTLVENHSQQLLNVFPNPSNGLIYFDDPANIITRVEVYDQLGKLIRSQNEKSVHTPIQLNASAQNMYYVKLHTKQGVVTKKVTMIK